LFKDEIKKKNLSLALKKILKNFNEQDEKVLFRTVCFCVSKAFLKKFKKNIFFYLLQINMFLVFSNHFDAVLFGTVCFCVSKALLKKYKIFLFFYLLQINMFLVFSNHFDELMSKIFF